MIIAVDTETTHYKAHLAEVIEIGAVTEDGDTFESLANPGIDLIKCQDALRVNGITEEEVLGAPDIWDVAQKFNGWLRSQYTRDAHIELCGYNSKNYDSRILARDPWRLPLSVWQYDVMEMAMTHMGNAGALPVHPYYGTLKWPKLIEAEAFFHIQREGKAHRALSDAKATLDILRAIQGMDEEIPETKGSSPSRRQA